MIRLVSTKARDTEKAFCPKRFEAEANGLERKRHFFSSVPPPPLSLMLCNCDEQEFFDSVPPKERNFYNSQSLEKMKRDFRELTSDRWDRKQMGDPSVDHDLARKVHPWGSYASREGLRRCCDCRR